MSKKFKLTYKLIGDDETHSVVYHSIYELYGGLSVLCDDFFASHDVVDLEIL